MDDEVYVFVVYFLDSKGFKKTMAIYDVDTVDECKKMFYKYEKKSVIKKIKRMSEYDYKHL